MTRLLRHARTDITTLAQNGPHMFAARQALVHYPSGAVYTFIPKNGCTNMRYSLALAHGCIAGPEDFAWIHLNNPTFQATLSDLVRAPYTFIFLRCPLERLASVFLDKIAGKTPEAWPLRRLTRDAFDLDDLTFRDFCTLMETPKYRNSNAHWRAQVDFLVYEHYDDWFDLRRFDDAIVKIRDRIGLEVHDTRALSDHGTDRYTLVNEGCYADRTVAELTAMQRAGESPAHAALYDDELIVRMQTCYGEDIRLYRSKFGEDGLLFP